MEGQASEVAGGVLAPVEAAVDDRRIRIDGPWVNTDSLELQTAALGVGAISPGDQVTFEFGLDTGLMAGAGLRLLSLLNQLSAAGVLVHLQFSTRERLFSYLDRNGFFGLLDPRISCDPRPPHFSSAILHRGQASSLVEIARLDPRLTGAARDDAVTPLVDKLIRFYQAGTRTKHLHAAAYGTLTELIDNVYSHAESRIAGFAVLQAYPRRRAVHIAVSDSGIGIPVSIRRSLRERVSTRQDHELIIDAFRKGLSRHGKRQGRSCGLPRCAELAAEFGSVVQVRTPSTDVTLLPHRGGPHRHHAQVRTPTVRLAGTHISLEFPLDLPGFSS